MITVGLYEVSGTWKNIFVMLFVHAVLLDYLLPKNIVIFFYFWPEILHEIFRETFNEIARHYTCKAVQPISDR